VVSAQIAPAASGISPRRRHWVRQSAIQIPPTIISANAAVGIAVNDRTSLNQLYGMMRELLRERFPHLDAHQPRYVDFRRGDVRHSQADITKAATLLGYQPTHRIGEGLQQAMAWYVGHLAPSSTTTA